MRKEVKGVNTDGSRAESRRTPSPGSQSPFRRALTSAFHPRRWRLHMSSLTFELSELSPLQLFLAVHPSSPSGLPQPWSPWTLFLRPFPLVTKLAMDAIAGAFSAVVKAFKPEYIYYTEDPVLSPTASGPFHPALDDFTNKELSQFKVPLMTMSTVFLVRSYAQHVSWLQWRPQFWKPNASELRQQRETFDYIMTELDTENYNIHHLGASKGMSSLELAVLIRRFKEFRPPAEDEDMWRYRQAGLLMLRIRNLCKSLPVSFACTLLVPRRALRNAHLHPSRLGRLVGGLVRQPRRV